MNGWVNGWVNGCTDGWSDQYDLVDIFGIYTVDR